jgi:hypothetical protein
MGFPLKHPAINTISSSEVDDIDENPEETVEVIFIDFPRGLMISNKYTINISKTCTLQ